MYSVLFHFPPNCCHNIFIFILFEDKTNKLPFSAPLWRWRGTSLSISQLQRLSKVYIFLNTRNTFNTELEYLRKLWECVMMCSVQYAMQLEIKSVPVYSRRAMAEIWNYGFDWYVKRLKLICTKVDDNMYKGWRRNWTHRDHGVLRRQSHQVRKPEVSPAFDKKTKKTNKPLFFGKYPSWGVKYLCLSLSLSNWLAGWTM